MMKAVAYASLALLYLLHTDVWYWNDPALVAGLPIGFTYHVLWTVVVSGAFWLAVRHAWPEHLEASETEKTAPATGADATTGGAS